MCPTTPPQPTFIQLTFMCVKGAYNRVKNWNDKNANANSNHQCVTPTTSRWIQRIRHKRTTVECDIPRCKWCLPTITGQVSRPAQPRCRQSIIQLKPSVWWAGINLITSPLNTFHCCCLFTSQMREREREMYSSSRPLCFACFILLSAMGIFANQNSAFRDYSDFSLPHEIDLSSDLIQTYESPGIIPITCPPDVLDTLKRRKDEPHEPFLSSRPSIAEKGLRRPNNCIQSLGMSGRKALMIDCPYTTTSLISTLTTKIVWHHFAWLKMRQWCRPWLVPAATKETRHCLWGSKDAAFRDDFVFSARSIILAFFH